MRRVPAWIRRKGEGYAAWRERCAELLRAANERDRDLDLGLDDEKKHDDSTNEQGRAQP